MPPAATVTTPPATATTPVPPAPVAATIQNFLFTPTPVTVPVGTTITWTNRDPAPHSIVSDVSGKFSSPTLGTGQSFSFTFTEMGSYPYHCGIHPSMHGTVVVT
jgi:plastocyanin